MNFDLFKRSESAHPRGRVGKSLRRTFSAAFTLFGAGDEEAETHRRGMALGLMRSVMECGGPLDAGALESFRMLFADEHSPIEIEHMVSLLRRHEPVSPEEAAACFAELPEAEKLQLIRSLLVLAVSGGWPPKSRELIADFSGRLGFPPEELETMAAEVENAEARRRQIIRSGAGVLVALIVIAVFILTATLLRSVIFGLIAAYVLLPVEKYFERRLRAKQGAGYCFFRITGWIFAPLRLLAGKLGRRNRPAGSDSPEAKALRAERTVINQAVGLTSVLVLLVVLALLLVLSSVTNHYVRNFSRSVRSWTHDNLMSAPAQTPAPEADAEAHVEKDASVPEDEASRRIASNGAEELLHQIQRHLDHLRDRFEALPLVKFGLDQISRLLNDEAAQRELVGILLKRTGGIFSFTASVLGTIGAVLADLLMTVFFFLLFLSKLAEFCTSNGSAGRQSEYLVRTVFNGSWLPGAKAETVTEAQRIIGGVMEKLRTWVRGYLTLMLVDATVYTTMFYFLRVPYFPVLGALAGCGILLPYIGPILSAALTLLVTLAAAGSEAGSFQLLAIPAVYLIYNGVIEQFILYPTVIGESLGLTTLETIIVVLLGAVFAGIPGMILAIPAASVMKYLVPQIYRCWEPSPEIRRTA